MNRLQDKMNDLVIEKNYVLQFLFNLFKRYDSI